MLVPITAVGIVQVERALTVEVEEVVGRAGPATRQRAGQRQRVVGPGAQRAQCAQGAQLGQRCQGRQRGARGLGTQRRRAQAASARGTRRVLLHPLAQARAASAHCS